MAIVDMNPVCTNEAPIPIPGVIPPVYEGGQGGNSSDPLYVMSVPPSDAGYTALPIAVTSASANVWVQLMPADAERLGGFIQSKAPSGSIYILPYNTGLPANGPQPGEIELPARPAFYGFDVQPDRRWVVRGDAVSLAFSGATWK